MPDPSPSNKESHILSLIIICVCCHLLSGQAGLEEADKVDFWKQRFDALSDESDSTIRLLKKENQQLREQVDSFKSQCSSTSIEGESLSATVKTEPQDDVTVTETHLSSTDAGELSGSGITKVFSSMFHMEGITKMGN